MFNDTNIFDPAIVKDFDAALLVFAFYTTLDNVARTIAMQLSNERDVSTYIATAIGMQKQFPGTFNNEVLQDMAQRYLFIYQTDDAYLQ
jgi:hypothetical protein